MSVASCLCGSGLAGWLAPPSLSKLTKSEPRQRGQGSSSEIFSLLKLKPTRTSEDEGFAKRELPGHAFHAWVQSDSLGNWRRFSRGIDNILFVRKRDKAC